MRTMAVVGLLIGVCAVNVAAAERVPGLLVRFYELDRSVSAVPELVPGQLPNNVRVVQTLDLGAPGESCAPMTDNFLTEVEGFLNIQQAGNYVFRLISDDGAVLFIDDTPVVDNDGLHGADPKDGRILLNPGYHALRVIHFDAGADERLALHWQPPGELHDQAFIPVPATAFTHDKAASRETAPGPKRIIPPLRRGLPGDGQALLQPHPGFAPDSLRATTLPITDDFVVKNGWLRAVDPTILGGVGCATAWIPGYHSNSQVLTRRGVGCAMPWIPGYHSNSQVLTLPGQTYSGQLLVNVLPQPMRIQTDRVKDALQGCASRFGFPVVDPTRDSGKLVFEMLAVRAQSNGFEIEFTKPLDPRCGWEVDSYYVEQWPFDMAKGVAPHRDGTVYPVKSASVSADRTKVFLEIPGLKESHVVYLRLLPPCVSADGEKPWSTEAWYTLNKVPSDRTGTVLAPPTPEPQNLLTAEEKTAGWELLFDGQTTNGWRGYRQKDFPAGWQVRDGCLVRVASTGDIITTESFENFELKIDWRISAAGNSGIFYRVDESVGAPWETGPEMQVLDNAEHADGRNPKTTAGSNYALYAPVRDVTQPVGFFNQAHILVNGAHVEHWLNGIKAVEYELGSPDWEARVADSKFKQWPQCGRIKKGCIVLQDHGDKVWYRNIKVRRLPAGQ